MYQNFGSKCFEYRFAIIVTIKKLYSLDGFCLGGLVTRADIFIISGEASRSLGWSDVSICKLSKVCEEEGDDSSLFVFTEL